MRIRTRVLVLGGSGMLGAMVTDFLSRQPDLQVSATVRNDQMKKRCQTAFPTVTWKTLDADTQDLPKITEILRDQEWIINAIGVIKPYVHDDNAAEVERAICVNALFPHLLAKAVKETGSRVLQIATDCVFSGHKGNYVETDKHDGLDVYGKTKSLGEVISKQVISLRCSIVGPERKAHCSLLDWLLSQPKGAMVNGYVNHRWNGITTLHYAKVCHGIIAQNLAMPALQHLIPTADITKCDLLKSFAASYQRHDLIINPMEAAGVVDRTLATINDSANQDAWGAAGYSEPPSVQQMVGEMAAYSWQPGEL